MLISAAAVVSTRSFLARQRSDDFAPTEAIIEDIARGKMVVIVDDEDRENEGDLVMASELVTPEAINFMAREGRGLICMTMTASRAEALALPMMVRRNGCPHGTNFTVSFDAAQGVTTGISAADRALTIQTAMAFDAGPADFILPGHVFGLVARPQGVIERQGHTEAGCDLARLAGLAPSATIVEIMNPDGTMARRPQLVEFCHRHNLRMGTIADLRAFRTRFGV